MVHMIYAITIKAAKAIPIIRMTLRSTTPCTLSFRLRMVSPYRPRNMSNAEIAIARIKIVIATNSRLTALSNPVVMFAILEFVSDDVLVVIS